MTLESPDLLCRKTMKEVRMTETKEEVYIKTDGQHRRVGTVESVSVYTQCISALQHLRWVPVLAWALWLSCFYSANGLMHTRQKRDYTREQAERETLPRAPLQQTRGDEN